MDSYGFIKDSVMLIDLFEHVVFIATKLSVRFGVQ